MALPFLDTWLIRRMGWTGIAVPSPEQLRSWQLDRLREIVAHASANSPFYRRHLKGVDPTSIGSLEDFSRLPMVASEDLRVAPEQFLCVSQDEIERVVTLSTSGTSGQPKRIFHTAEDLEATVDYFAWGMSNLLESGQTVFVLMPGDRPGGVGRLLFDGVARIGARVVTHGVMEDADEALEQCLAEGAQCIVGSAAHVNALACAWERQGLPSGRIRSVLLCWDAISDAVAHNAQRIFGCRVFRHWGMIETGLGGAVECTPDSGMHLRETDVYLEIVNPETGLPVPDGQLGEMVVSTPLRRGMPLIRYRTGDAGRIMPGPCACGSPLRRLDPQIDRLDSGVAVGAGRLVMRDLNEALYGVQGLADYAARLAGKILIVEVCGTGADLPEKVGFALETIPCLRQALSEKKLEIKTVVLNTPGPAIAGLGKRGILTDREIDI